MPWPVYPHGFLGAQGDSDTYRIERSLRFNSADSAYLSRTLGTPTNSTIFTFSAWLKRSLLGSTQGIFATNSQNGFYFDSDDKIYVAHNNVNKASTTGVYRDISSWYHVMYVQNGSNITLYINGNSVATGTGSPLNINTAIGHTVGSMGALVYFNGYLTEINFVDGQALTPSSFGETDAITGRWKAKAYSGTYGTNGFYLNFSDNSSLTTTSNVGIGKDFSGNGNYWATNGLSVMAGAGNDSLVDSPTNYGADTGVGGEVRGNYMTFNPLDSLSISGSSSNGSISDGNLRSVSSSTAYSAAYSTFTVPNSGKFKFEATVLLVAAGQGNQFIGLTDRTNVPLYWSHTGGIVSTGGSSNATTYTTNDVLTFEIDRTSQTAVFYKNGTQVHSTAFTTQGDFWVISYNGATTGAGFAVNFGQRPYQYGATGFKALCTTNLPQPTIQKPSKYMDVVTYTGNGSTQTISSLGFSPDLVWIKSRAVARSHRLLDTIRGVNSVLTSDTTGAEYSSGTPLSSFNSNGFSLTNSDDNVNSETYVAWAWDEAPIAGMDIVAFTAPASGNTTINHSLGVAPKMIIAKSRDLITSWTVYHASATTKNQYLFLNGTNAVQTLTDVWGSSAPTSSVFGFNSNNQGASASVIAYVFAEVEGFSKFGSYTGNGSSDGPFVWCGFRPRWVMIKQTNTTSSNSNWFILDSARNTFNTTDAFVHANTSNAEYGASVISDFLSNGFKLRIADSLEQLNTSTKTYIFAAFAESAFKYCRAR